MEYYRMILQIIITLITFIIIHKGRVAKKGPFGRPVTFKFEAVDAMVLKQILH